MTTEPRTIRPLHHSRRTARIHCAILGRLHPDRRYRVLPLRNSRYHWRCVELPLPVHGWANHLTDDESLREVYVDTDTERWR